MANTKLDSFNSKSFYQSSTWEGVSSGTDKVLTSDGRCGSLIQNTRPNELDGMEKLIYVHVVNVGKYTVEDHGGYSTKFEGATNDWYVIERQSDGSLEISRAFKDLNQLNCEDGALVNSTCQVIGSRIYVIGGCHVTSYLVTVNIIDPGSKKIRYLDTHNTQDGWVTLPLSLPLPVNRVKSAVVDDQWLYFVGGNRFYHKNDAESWGYGVNVLNPSETTGRRITGPGQKLNPYPIACASLSPGTLIALIPTESTLFQLDCASGSWTVYEKLPYSPHKFSGCTTISDGILYNYDIYKLCFTAYDIPNRKHLYEVDLPKHPWFDFDEVQVHLLVLAKNKFCFIRHSKGLDPNYVNVYYVRFYVCDHLNKLFPVERQSFYIPGYKVLNVVAVDPRQRQ